VVDRFNGFFMAEFNWVFIGNWLRILTSNASKSVQN